MALKLSANPMYVCVGFEHSRFYVRPLAALTAFRRNIRIGGKHGLEDDDIDSVSVNSNQNNVGEAFEDCAPI